ncbi:MAG: hypothetical protein IIC89_06865, partial [Chloroflexi bacterium]|nr:hypothetical protein [Chloroflexota bacterium]
DDLNQPAGVAFHLARALLQTGSVEGASALVERHAERLINRPGRSTSTILGDVAAQLEMPDLWTACYELLLQERLPLVIYYVPISVRRVLGRLAARLKLWPAAFEHFDTAAKQLAAGGARWEHAQTLLNYAEARRARRRRADAGKAAALELEAKAVYQELGIPFEAPSHETGANRFGLTGRELEVLELMARGSRNHEIAEALTISQGTAARHVENILNKFGVSNRVEAIMKAVETSLVGPLRNSQGASPATGDADDALSDTGS